MLDELSIHSLAKKLDTREEKIVEGLLGYKNVQEKFSPYNPFILNPKEIEEELVGDRSCLDSFNSLAMPLEYLNWHLGQIVLDNPPGQSDEEIKDWMSKVFNLTSIAAVDASTVEHDLHLNLLYAYTQIGVFWKTIGRYKKRITGDVKVGDELYQTKRNFVLYDHVDYQKWNWDLTIDVLREHFTDNMPFFLFLDESLSISYARNYTYDRQAFLLSSLQQYLRQLDGLSIIPVAVYHSLDRCLVNTGLKCSACKIQDMCKNCDVKPSQEEILFKTLYDKFFLWNILVDNYSRTPYFRPLNSVIAKSCSDIKLDLASFYLRIDDSILRVEFPFKYVMEDKDNVEKIRRAVVADSLLIKGYPATLANAHELAVLSAQDRSTINELVYRKTLELSKKYGLDISVKFTRKGELKRRRLL